MKTLLCIPTLNAGPHLAELLPAIRRQTTQPDDVLVIDSSSDDETAEAFAGIGAHVHRIPRADFDHGGTRQLALELYPDAEVLLYLTQDAIPADHQTFEALRSELLGERVGAAYGRQLPRTGADAIEAHARFFNYPPHSAVKTISDARALGIKAAFLSNSFSAYRRSALEEVGGFPRRNIFGEDMHAAARLLMRDWRVAYVADAMVRHSHPYTHLQEFRRYFDVGVFLSHNEWITSTFGRASGEGFRYLKSEIRYLASTDARRLPQVLSRSVMKLLGMHLGRYEGRLPTRIKRTLSMNKAFWTQSLERARA